MLAILSRIHILISNMKGWDYISTNQMTLAIKFGVVLFCFGFVTLQITIPHIR